MTTRPDILTRIKAVAFRRGWHVIEREGAVDVVPAIVTVSLDDAAVTDERGDCAEMAEALRRELQ